MLLSIFAPPPPDPEIARRLLASTAFEVPERAVLAEVEPWTLFEAKMAVHATSTDVEVVHFTVTPPWLRVEEARVLRTSGARWQRPSELPPIVLERARRELERWKARRGAEHRSASVLVRAEHGYRMRFRSASEVVTIDLAVSPPRIVTEDRCPVLPPRRSAFAALRRVGRAWGTLIAGGAPPS